MNDVRQGEVYWFDFGRAAGSGPSDVHPCVVIQSDVFNRTRIATTVVCVITSNVNRAKAPGNVLLEKGNASLPRTSVVNISQVMTVDKAELEERIGQLSPAKVDAIRAGLQALFERS